MGRPLGSKNRPKIKTEENAPPTEPKKATNEDFDKLNNANSSSRIDIKPVHQKTTPKKRKRESESPAESPPKNGVNDDDEPQHYDENVVSVDLSDGGKDQAQTVKIIQLGTEEAKYALLPTNREDDEDSDHGDYNHDIHFVADEPEDEMEEAIEVEYGDDGIEEVETSGIKHAKKYPSKQKYPCPKCPKVWNWAWELRRHLVVHFKPSKYGDGGHKCDKCDKKFQWRRDLKQHMRFHTGEKVLFCSVCERQFITKQALLHHVVVHTGERPFQCAVCGNKFTQPANLRTHVKKKHNYNPEANKNNKCEYCGEPHQSVVHLHQHLLEDHPQQVQEEREILAREKQQKLKERLEKEKEKEERRVKPAALGHKVRKPKRKEWEMDFEFYIGDGLVRGVDWDRTPSNGEIACGQCDRKFGWRFEIMFHGLCHLTDDQGNARNKVCPECDTPFKVPIGLKHHLITHTGETPFLCLHCWKSFSSHIDLKLHVKKEHMLHTKEKKAIMKKDIIESEERGDDIEEELEEQTSHYVQLEDGTYAEMVDESAATVVQAGQTIVVKSDKGETMVVVNPEERLTTAETSGHGQVYVIAAENGEANTVLPDKESLERLIGDSETIEMIVEEEDAKVIQVDEINEM